MNKTKVKKKNKKNTVKMSCFPTLAALSLRDSSKSKTKTHRHSTGGEMNNDKNIHNSPPIPPSSIQQLNNGQQRHNINKEFMPKLEVLQDLDLYYIRQIASSLKVTFLC